MHELSIALSLMDAAREEAARHGGARVAALHLRLGPLSGVLGQALRSAYDLAREATDLADAELMIEETAVTIYCPACCAEHPAVSAWEVRCSVCGSGAEKIVSGRELELVALELES